MTKKEKPSYNLFQNSAYMLKVAWATNNARVIWLCLAAITLTITASLLALFVTPTILAAIQARVPLWELVRLILIFSGAMLVVGALKSYVDVNHIVGRISVRCNGFVVRANQKVSTTSYPNLQDQEFMKKTTRAADAMSTNDAAVEGIWATLTELATNILGLVIYLILLANLTTWVVALVLVTTIAGFFVTRHVVGWEERNIHQRNEITNPLMYLQKKRNDRDIAKDIRLFGMGPWLFDINASLMRALKAFSGRRERVLLIGSVTDVVLTFVRSGVAYIYLIGLVVAGELSAPEFLLLFTAVGGFATWIGGVLSEFNTLRRHSLEISNVRDVFDYPEPFNLEGGIPLQPEAGKEYQLELRNVSFRYPGAETDTLTNINLTIAPGEKLAIVGLNGAGKTTLVRLMSGFHDPTQGEVLLNGQDIRQYNRLDYYKHFTAVFQEYSILPISISENIAQTLPDEIDHRRVKECAKRADIASKLEEVGYDTPLTKIVFEHGIELSGGETQRLILARALYKDAPIILLDEPTAALDAIAEKEMYEKYHELTANRTSIYISHRLASTRFCDRIILVEEGAITEEGTHEGLIQQNGRYAELFDIQSQYYREVTA